jgi:hypothetical protein
MSSPRPANPPSGPVRPSPAGVKEITDPAKAAPRPADPPPASVSFAPAGVDTYVMISALAETVTELEHARIAGENRLRAAVREAEDKDGQVRPPLVQCPPEFEADSKTLVADLVGTVGTVMKDGNGKKPKSWHILVWIQASAVWSLKNAEQAAIKALEQEMAKHPLGPWLSLQKGVGMKTAARLLGAIGNPAFRPEITREDGTVEPERRRGLYELYAYCGHGDPGRRRKRGMTREEAQLLGSAEAKKRTWLIATGMLKAGNRDAYDKARVKYGNREGWTAGHQHAAGLRIQGKTFLKAMWRECRRIEGIPDDPMQPPSYFDADQPANVPPDTSQPAPAE